MWVVFGLTMCFGPILGAIVASLFAPFAVPFGAMVGFVVGVPCAFIVGAVFAGKQPWPMILAPFAITLLVGILTAAFHSFLLSILATASTLCMSSLLVRRYAPDRQRPRTGFCYHCGYNLTGNVSGICSECGTVIRSREPSRIV
jgi:hypothetical protein